MAKIESLKNGTIPNAGEDVANLISYIAGGDVNGTASLKNIWAVS